MEYADEGAEKTRCKVSVLPKTLAGRGVRNMQRRKRAREHADDGAEKTRCKVSVLPKALNRVDAIYNEGKGQGRMQSKLGLISWEDEMQSFGSPEDFDRDVAICNEGKGQGRMQNKKLGRRDAKFRFSRRL